MSVFAFRPWGKSVWPSTISGVEGIRPQSLPGSPWQLFWPWNILTVHETPAAQNSRKTGGRSWKLFSKLSIALVCPKEFFIHIHIRSWTLCFVAFSIFSLSWGNSELFGSFSRYADNSNRIYSLCSFAFSGEKHFIRYDNKPLQWTVMYAAVGGRNAEKTVQNMRTIISFLLYSVLSKRGIDNSYLIYSSCLTFFSIRVDWLHFAFTRLTVFTAGCESSKVRAL